MKRLFWFIGVLLTLFAFFAGCSRVSADINEEVVFDKHPFFEEGGIDMVPLKQGSCYKSATTKAYKFVMTPTQFEENFTNLFTRDQTSVNLNAFLTLQLKKGKTPLLLYDFGLDWYKNSIQEPFREMVRNKLCTFDMLELVSGRGIYDTIKYEIQEQIKEHINKIKIPVDVIALVISKVEPPEEVRNELNLISLEKSKKQTQILRLQTEEARLESEKASAKADRAYMLEMGFNQSQYIEYLRAKALQNRSDVIRIENIK
jgi:regulator of protease activity HflC (stomatin/prohibitin superfamily)